METSSPALLNADAWAAETPGELPAGFRPITVEDYPDDTEPRGDMLSRLGADAMYWNHDRHEWAPLNSSAGPSLFSAWCYAIRIPASTHTTTTTTMETTATTPSRKHALSNELETLLQQHPTSKFTRALIRAKYDVALPSDLTDYEPIRSWLDEHIVMAPPAPRPSATSSHSHSHSRSREDTITVSLCASGYESGSECFTQNWTCSELISIPLSVAREGADAIRGYVREHADFNNREYGDRAYDNDVSWDDGDTTDEYIDHNDIQAALDWAEEQDVDDDDDDDDNNTHI